MRIIIYAAGKSRRFNSNFQQLPKGLIKVGNKRLIEYGLSRLSKYKPEEIIIIVGYKAEMFKQHLGNSYKGIKIKYVFNEHYDMRGNMSSLWAARDYCDRDVLFTVSDLICSKRNIELFMHSSFDNKILVDTNPKYFSDPDPVKVVINDGNIRTVLKDVSAKDVSGVAIGIYKLSKEKISQLIDEIKVYMDSNSFDLSLYYAIDKLSKKVDINPVFCEESNWYDIDTAGEMKEAEKNIDK